MELLGMNNLIQGVASNPFVEAFAAGLSCGGNCGMNIGRNAQGRLPENKQKRPIKKEWPYSYTQKAV